MTQTKPFYRVALESGKDYWWCACGLSKAQPFCDGSHKSVPEVSKPQKFSVEDTRDYVLCGCKNTRKGPFCDGSHKDD